MCISDILSGILTFEIISMYKCMKSFTIPLKPLTPLYYEGGGQMSLLYKKFWANMKPQN